MIVFGTDGWRGIINEDFTIDNLRIVSQAVADYYNNEVRDNNKYFFIGYDTRLNSKEYAIETTQILLNNNINAIIAEDPITTPMLSFAVKKYGGMGGIMITASHNPPEFNGVKVKGSYGGSATPDIIKKIEEYLYKTSPRLGIFKKPGSFNPTSSYIKQLQDIVDFDAISNLKGSIIVDPMFGAGSGYLAKLVTLLDLKTTEIHSAPNPSFGGINPEPIASNLQELSTIMKKSNYILGLALDGDGDRLGLINQKGDYINSHQIYAILLRYLTLHKGWRGGVVKTFSTTDIISKMAKAYNLPIYETPIGFKYICDLFLKEDILMGGEESGGFGFKYHLPERDGILAGLLLLETIAKCGQINDQLEQIYDHFNPFYYQRLDIKPSQANIKKTFNCLKENPPHSLGEFNINIIENLDGIKLRFSDSWLLLRSSGTEPLVRIYSEGIDEQKVTQLCNLGKKLFE